MISREKLKMVKKNCKIKSKERQIFFRKSNKNKAILTLTSNEIELEYNIQEEHKYIIKLQIMYLYVKKKDTYI